MRVAKDVGARASRAAWLRENSLTSLCFSSYYKINMKVIIAIASRVSDERETSQYLQSTFTC